MQELLTYMPAPTLEGILAGGNRHSIVLRNGIAYSCGSNHHKQSGIDEDVIHPLPIRMNLPPIVLSVVATDDNTLVVLEDGRVYGCGTNDYYQLGIGLIKPAPLTLMVLPSPALSVSISTYHSAVVLQDGRVFGCGENDNGRLGTNDTNRRHFPVQMQIFGSAMSVACTGRRTYVLLENGEVYYYGHEYEAVLIELDEPVIEIVAGQYHVLFLLAGGRVFGMGSGISGQLGNGESEDAVVPTEMILPELAVTLTCGRLHSLVLLMDGRVFGCGGNNRGQLNHTDLESDFLVPREIVLPRPVTAIGAGRTHSLFLLEDERVFGCGNNRFGQLGTGEVRMEPEVPPVEMMVPR
jgi:E3 ubiquitin-protein ligase HERC4